MGMSEEFLARLFEPFTRSHSAERIEGTGLGLSVTKGLVDLMGGTIHVQSREGQGSVFTVELEGQQAEADAVAPKQSTATEQTDALADRPLDGRMFLVAEDNAINAEILSELLLMEGGQSRIVTDGAAAVQAFESAAPGTYDAVLMDIQMPVMNGYEATRAIRELTRADAEAVPIVAMTANAFAEDVQASLDAGMTAHVAKPIDVAVLKDTLLKVLQR